MRRSLRLVLFFALVVCVWSLCSEQVLSRIATDETGEDYTPERADGEGEADYQVVRLLSKLFTLVKRNYADIVDLDARLDREGERQRQSHLKQQLVEKIGRLEGKVREYRNLEPTLRQQYPGLKAILGTLSKDMGKVVRGLDKIKAGNGLEETSLTPDGFANAPARIGSRQGASRSLVNPSIDPPNDSSVDSPVDSQRPRPPLSPAQRSEKSGEALPITLEIQGARGEGVSDRRVLFRAKRDDHGLLQGILDDTGGVVSERAVLTDRSGKATVRIQVGPASQQIRIRRTIMPQENQTVCQLEATAIR